MFLHTLTVLVGYMAVASSREALRPMPTITNSLVNLGKMDVSFYLSGNGRDGLSHARKPDHGPAFPPAYFPKLEPVTEEQCLCSSHRNTKDSFLTNPTGLINKILSNSNMFSSNNNDAVRSTLCCDSHEHLEEGSIYFEITPDKKPMKPSAARSNPQPMMPFLFDSIIPNKSMLPVTKTKAIELILFPKRKDFSSVMSNFDMPKYSYSSKKRDTIPKDAITVVGDKKLENNIDLFKPPPPPVKKDLSAQQKQENETEKPAEEPDKMDPIMVELASKPNAV